MKIAEAVIVFVIICCAMGYADANNISDDALFIGLCVIGGGLIAHSGKDD